MHGSHAAGGALTRGCNRALLANVSVDDRCTRGWDEDGRWRACGWDQGGVVRLGRLLLVLFLHPVGGMWSGWDQVEMSALP